MREAIKEEKVEMKEDLKIEEDKFNYSSCSEMNITNSIYDPIDSSKAASLYKVNIDKSEARGSFVTPIIEGLPPSQFEKEKTDYSSHMPLEKTPPKTLNKQETNTQSPEVVEGLVLQRDQKIIMLPHKEIKLSSEDDVMPERWKSKIHHVDSIEVQIDRLKMDIMPYQMRIKYYPDEEPPSLFEWNNEKGKDSGEEGEGDISNPSILFEEDEGSMRELPADEIPKGGTSSLGKSLSMSKLEEDNKLNYEEDNSHDKSKAEISHQSPSQGNLLGAIQEEEKPSSELDQSAMTMAAIERKERKEERKKQMKLVHEQTLINMIDEQPYNGEKEEFDIEKFLKEENYNWNFREQANQIRLEDAIKKQIITKWSGEEVLENIDPFYSQIMTDRLRDIRFYDYGFSGLFTWVRFITKKFVKSIFFEQLMTVCVLTNTIVLAFDRYGIPESEEKTLRDFNLAFTIIFMIELVLKLFGMGVHKYLSDSMNYLDGGVVLLSIVELSMGSGSNTFSAFRTVRIFRTFRVLRVARLLRALHSMQVIISVIGSSIENFVFIALLLIIFIFIYALLGMQLFGGRFEFYDGIPRMNFNSFWAAFLSVFQILTMENWQQIFYNAMRYIYIYIYYILFRCSQNGFLTSFFFVTWIFIGNFVLLNMFLAVLLDSFTRCEEAEEEHDMQYQALLEEKENKKKLKLEQNKETNKSLIDKSVYIYIYIYIEFTGQFICRKNSKSA